MVVRTEILDRIGEKFCGSNRESNNSTFYIYIYIYIYIGPAQQNLGSKAKILYGAFLNVNIN